MKLGKVIFFVVVPSITLLLFSVIWRAVPAKHFYPFVVLVVVLIGLEVVIAKTFRGELKDKPHLARFLDLALSILLGAAIFLFVSYIYPGTR